VPGPLTPLLLIAVGFLAQFFLQRSLSRRFDYGCENCGRVFAVAPLAACVAPHRFGGDKFVKCPRCGRRSWVRRVPKG